MAAGKINEPQIEEYNPDLVPFSRESSEWTEYILSLVESNKNKELETYLKEFYPADIAHLLGKIEFESGIKIFQMLDQEFRGEVLNELQDDLQRLYLKTLSPDELVKIITEQQSDEAADMIEELEPGKLSEVLSRTPLDDRVKIIELLSYPENSAGSIMAKEFVCVKENDTVKSATQRIRKTFRDTEDYYTVYVIDEDGKYKGHISLKNLIVANPRTRIKKIMEDEIIPIPLFMDQEEVANFFTRYDFITVPVVDANGVMVGRITADDILEVMQEEASEDILMMGGHITGDESLSAPLLASSFKRIIWLSMNLLTAFIAASVVSYFQTTIGKAVILAALMPIVTGMGGNAASQTMAIIVRNIALGGITLTHAGRAVVRELLLGVLNGLFLGVVTGIIVYFVMRNESGSEIAFVFGSIIALAMFINMLVAALAGAYIPVFLKKMDIDPAIASSIFVTTCTDVLGFFVFLGLASIAIMHGLI